MKQITASLLLLLPFLAVAQTSTTVEETINLKDGTTGFVVRLRAEEGITADSDYTFPASNGGQAVVSAPETVTASPTYTVAQSGVYFVDTTAGAITFEVPDVGDADTGDYYRIFKYGGANDVTIQTVSVEVGKIGGSDTKVLSDTGAGIELLFDSTASTYRITQDNTASLGGSYVTVDGTTPLTASWDAGSFDIQAETFTSDVTTGTSPLAVSSTTLVSNLNVQYVGGLTSANLLDRTNHTGTQTASTISDFDTEVSTNTDVAANTSARHDAVTVSGAYDYITLSGQDIVRGQVDLTTDVTGVLPDANVAGDLTVAGGTIGTSAITLVQSASPAPTSEGVIEWDSDDDKLTVGDGVGTAVIGPFWQDTGTLSPVTQPDNFSLVTDAGGVGAITLTSTTGVIALTSNSVGSPMTVDTENSLEIQLGDSGGTQSLSILDSGSTEVAAIDSDGVIFATGIDKPSGASEVFNIQNSGAGDMELQVDGTAVLAPLLTSLADGDVLEYDSTSGDFVNVPHYVGDLANGLSQNRPQISVVSNGVDTVTVSVTVDGGGDLVYYYDKTPWVLDTDPTAATVTLDLTGATPTRPVLNYVYVIPSTTPGVLDLKASQVRPNANPGEESGVIMFKVGTYDAATAFDDTNPESETNAKALAQRYTELVDGPNERSRISHIGERIRTFAATWESGTQLTGTNGTTSTTPFSGTAATLDFTVGSGASWQMHLQSTVATTLDGGGTGDLWYIYRSDTGAFVPVDTIADLTGVTMGDGTSTFDAGDYAGFEIVVLGTSGDDGGSTVSQKTIIIPSYSVYSSLSDSINDVNNYAITSIPNLFVPASFRVGRLVLSRSGGAGTTWTVQEIQDRRGQLLSAASGGGGVVTSGTVFSDATLRINNATDNTKQIALSAAAITTATTRTYTAPNDSGTWMIRDAAAAAPVANQIPYYLSANDLTSGSTLTYSGTLLSLTESATLGDAAADTLTVNATTTFNGLSYVDLTATTPTGAISWNCNTDQVYEVTLTANRTITLNQTPEPGAVYTLIVNQDGVGGYTLTFSDAGSAAFLFPSGVDPVVANGANEITIISFVCNSDGDLLGMASYDFE